MTRRPTRIAALGAGAFMALGIYSATPAGATDGAQADAHLSTDGISAEATNAIGQTLGLVNQACNDATHVGGAAASAVTSTEGISVAATPAGQGASLDLSLPALTESLPVVGGLLSGVTGQSRGQIDVAQPLRVVCDTTGNGSAGLSAAGVEALLHAIVPGVDVADLADLGLDLPALGLSGEATTGAAPPASAKATTQVPAAVKANASAASVRSSATAPAARTSATASASPASASGGLVAETVGSPGALARTGAGLGGLGLLGTFLFGGGRFFAFGRKFLH